MALINRIKNYPKPEKLESAKEIADYTMRLYNAIQSESYERIEDFQRAIDAYGGVPNTRTISTTSPLSGGGDLSADRTLSLAGLSSLGTANYLIGTNSGATAWEYKQILGTTNQISITHAANSITLSAPQNIHTGASPQFANLVITGGGDIRPSADSTTALNIANAAGTDWVTFDTTNQKVGIGQTSPTAVLHLKAGTASANTAPLKLTSGTLLTTPEAGAMEFLTDSLYFTMTTGPTRKTLAFTSDVPATTYKMRAYLSADQTNLPNSTITLVNLDAEDYDPGNNFNTATHIYTVPVTGYYLIIGCIFWHATDMVADKQYNAMLYKGANIISQAYVHSAVAGGWLCSYVSGIFYLAANDEITLKAYQVSGGNTIDIYGGISGTSLMIHLLST